MSMLFDAVMSAAPGAGASGGGQELMQLMVSTPDGQLISLGALPPVHPKPATLLSCLRSFVSRLLNGVEGCV